MPPIDRDGIALLRSLGQGMPRYSSSPLPPYRFVPGLTPHPIADPRGHSYGLSPGPVEVPPARQWRRCEPYLFGCDLFNRGYWWEAHEAWEGLWQNCRERHRQHRFLQGLIQAANAQLKLALGKGRAVSRLWAKAEEHFLAADLGPHFMGLPVAAWRHEMMHYIADRQRTMPLRHDPAGFPLILLRNFS